LDGNDIHNDLRGTDVSHVYINYGKTTSGGEGLYFYNQSIGNTALQDGFVKVSHIDQGKLSFRSTGVRDVVSLNFNQLNDNGKQTGLVVLDRIESGYSDTSDNYDIISSHGVSTIDVNSSLTNINHIETVSLSGESGVFNISCTTQDLYVTDISAANTIDASFITVHNVEGGRIQTNDFSAVNVTIDGNTNVNGNSTFYSDIVAKEYFRGNHLTLSGDAIFDQDIHVYGDINAYKDISLNGNIKLNGTLFVSDTVTIGSSSENETLLVKNNITIGLDAVDTDHTVTISGDISLNGAIYGDSIQLKNAAHMKSIVMDGTDTLDLSSSSIVFNYNDNIITLSNFYHFYKIFQVMYSNKYLILILQ
jgi:cytoskeletal protein CcmA (bactofilin family)